MGAECAGGMMYVSTSQRRWLEAQRMQVVLAEMPLPAGILILHDHTIHSIDLENQKGGFGRGVPGVSSTPCGRHAHSWCIQTYKLLDATNAHQARLTPLCHPVKIQARNAVQYRTSPPTLNKRRRILLRPLPIQPTRGQPMTRRSSTSTIQSRSRRPVATARRRVS